MTFEASTPIFRPIAQPGCMLREETLLVPKSSKRVFGRSYEPLENLRLTVHFETQDRRIANRSWSPIQTLRPRSPVTDNSKRVVWFHVEEWIEGTNDSNIEVHEQYGPRFLKQVRPKKREL